MNKLARPARARNIWPEDTNVKLLEMIGDKTAVINSNTDALYALVKDHLPKESLTTFLLHLHDIANASILIRSFRDNVFSRVTGHSQEPTKE